jgi:hypothetical protein
MAIAADLHRALDGSLAARRTDSLTTPQRRRFSSYLRESKRPATRARRLRGAMAMLSAGQGHPRCSWSRDGRPIVRRHRERPARRRRSGRQRLEKRNA